MSFVVTLSDVQRWVACRQVYLRPGATLTLAARRWLAEHDIEVVTEPPGGLSLPEEAGPSSAQPPGGAEGAERGSRHVQRAIITVLGQDRAGIIVAIAKVLACSDVNILDINQTLFGDLFSMTMAVDIGRASVSFAELKEALEKTGEELRLRVLVQREAVFDYMHRV